MRNMVFFINKLSMRDVLEESMSTAPEASSAIIPCSKYVWSPCCWTGVWGRAVCTAEADGGAAQISLLVIFNGDGVRKDAQKSDKSTIRMISYTGKETDWAVLHMPVVAT